MLGDQCGDRGFKALKQTVKLHYKLGNYKHMMDAYREMLTYIRSVSTTSLILFQAVLVKTWSCCKSSTRLPWKHWKRPKMRLVPSIRSTRNVNWIDIYLLFPEKDTSMRHLKPHVLMMDRWVVQRLWFKTNLKLCKLWFDMGEYGRMNKVKSMYPHCALCLPLY
jgi:COP9 signalosome complex subunit 2